MLQAGAGAKIARQLIAQTRPAASVPLAAALSHISPTVHKPEPMNSARAHRGFATSPATADLCDEHVESPTRPCIGTPGYFNDYGGIKKFHGRIETVKCFESNPLVRKTLGEAGDGRVLVVDGGASTRCAILGDLLATMARDNGWSGVVVNGYIRDSAVIAGIEVGVKARGTHPLKSIKTHMGERGATVAFAGVEFVPGHWLYADEDGILISETELRLPDSKL